MPAPFIDGLPSTLIAFAIWADHDPDAYAHFSASFTLGYDQVAGTYSGKSAPDGNRLELNLTPAIAADTWDVQLLIYDNFRDPEDFVWSGIKIPPGRPFELIPEPDVDQPGYDFRRVLIRS